MWNRLLFFVPMDCIALALVLAHKHINMHGTHTPKHFQYIASSFASFYEHHKNFDTFIGVERARWMRERWKRKSERHSNKLEYISFCLVFSSSLSILWKVWSEEIKIGNYFWCKFSAAAVAIVVVAICSLFLRLLFHPFSHSFLGDFVGAHHGTCIACIYI